MTILDIVSLLAALAFGFYAGRLERRSRAGAFECPGCHHDKSFHSDEIYGCNHQRDAFSRTVRCGCRSTRGELEELEFKTRRRDKDDHTSQIRYDGAIAMWNPLGGDLNG